MTTQSMQHIAKIRRVANRQRRVRRPRTPTREEKLVTPEAQRREVLAGASNSHHRAEDKWQSDYPRDWASCEINSVRNA